MIAALLLLGQAAGPVIPAGDHCAQRRPDEVVVCRRRADDGRYRVRPIADADRFERNRRLGLPRAEVAALGGTMSADVEDAQLAGGQVSHRAKITYKLKF